MGCLAVTFKPRLKPWLERGGAGGDDILENTMGRTVAEVLRGAPAYLFVQVTICSRAANADLARATGRSALRREGPRVDGCVAIAYSERSRPNPSARRSTRTP